MADGAPPPRAAALSWGLGCYAFDEYKTRAKKAAAAAAAADGAADGAAEKPKFASLLWPADELDGEAGAALTGARLRRARAPSAVRPARAARRPPSPALPPAGRADAARP